MLVNIIETFENGSYSKGASTSISGKEVILGVVTLSGPLFAERLSQFKNGYSRSEIVDVPVNLDQKNSIRLTLPKA